MRVGLEQAHKQHKKWLVKAVAQQHVSQRCALLMRDEPGFYRPSSLDNFSMNVQVPTSECPDGTALKLNLLTPDGQEPLLHIHVLLLTIGILLSVSRG